MPSIHEGFYGDSRLADAFFKLQRQAFPSLDLEEAHRRGLLDEQVVPFGIFDDESHALSILNATSMELIVDGRSLKGLQIGTVATAPSCRGQGLSSRLLHHVLQRYEGTTDLQFLFANETVLEFYPRFGFRPIREHDFHFVRQAPVVGFPFRRLGIDSASDAGILRGFFENRDVVSRRMGVVGHARLAELNCRYAFRNSLWYSGEWQAVLVASSSGGVLRVHDCICRPHNDRIFIDLGWPGITSVILEFVPDRYLGEFIPRPLPQAGFFVRGPFPKSLHPVRFPALAQT